MSSDPQPGKGAAGGWPPRKRKEKRKRKHREELVLRHFEALSNGEAAQEPGIGVWWTASKRRFQASGARPLAWRDLPPPESRRT